MSERHIYAVLGGDGNVIGISDLSGAVDIPEHAKVKEFRLDHIGKKLKKDKDGKRVKDADGFDVLQ